MAVDDPKIQAIYRYPVKGLSPEGLTSTRLAPYETLPADRLYAIENGPSGFDPTAPRYQPKQRYLMLMRNERLARLRARFEEASHTLAIEWRARKRRAATCGQRRAARPSNVSSPVFAPTNFAGRRACCTRRASASPMWRARWFRSSILHP